jgi:hypothetical protein
LASPLSKRPLLASPLIERPFFASPLSKRPLWQVPLRHPKNGSLGKGPKSKTLALYKSLVRSSRSFFALLSLQVFVVPFAVSSVHNSQVWSYPKPRSLSLSLSLCREVVLLFFTASKPVRFYSRSFCFSNFFHK